jgi:hypothetical protein
MFRQYHIIQCRSTGDFVCLPVLFIDTVNGATLFHSYDDAIDTAHDLLDDDFSIFSFYRKEELQPSTLVGRVDSLEFTCPPK